MAILEERSAARRMVAWLNTPPPCKGLTAFKRRGFEVVQCSDLDLEDPAFLSGLSAVIFSQDPQKLFRVVEELKRHSRLLLDMDCRILVRPADIGLTSFFIEHLPRLGLDVVVTGRDGFQRTIPPHPFIRFSPEPWERLANVVIESVPGHAPNLALKPWLEDRIDQDGKKHKVYLKKGAIRLLQRAFWDCASLHLNLLEGGRSGACVFRADAELKGLRSGWPQPYFVKIGPRGKIYQEYSAFINNVRPYIPFHLRPRVLETRCFLGATQGIMVGDFVGESESLSYCARDSRSSPAIACLFDRTLIGWHRRAESRNTTMASLLQDRFPKVMPPERIKKARELGSHYDLTDLRRLFEGAPAGEIMVGPIHGDLHAENVRVRANDAIVIDFLAHQSGPILFDAATLEASMLVDCFPKVGDQEWLDSISSLYRGTLLVNAPSGKDLKSRFYWFHASVHQIRRHARQWGEPNQYATALSVALLVKASKDPQAKDKEDFRRAAAYVLAERILVESFGPRSPQDKDSHEI
jgi:hypothetical protein